MIRSMASADWPAVREIYREGIESGNATFETVVPEWEAWSEGKHPTVRLVACDGDEVLGFATISLVSKRPVYAGVGEVMVYVAARARGRGIGRELLDALVAASESAGFWTLQAGIFPENAASLLAHERAGFRVVGRRARIGRFHDGRWRDTILLERRSDTVGTD